ncbi:MAG TPA: molecular chaperone HtpG [Candidatus Coprovivens excrementavium]|nr:molecular chaperone HtpG [Candidatus Coprovivens excrementavium]
MKKKQFKTESKKILDLMINSVYTNRDIFLRELISNASDAIDKLYYKSLTDRKVKLDKDDFCIRIDVDKENRVLTITDNGIGMTEQELDDNLGIIAKSGSSLFKEMNEKKKDVNIIGQFGVGFYSAFMVAKEIRVLSRAYGSDKAYLWVSDGADGYTITEASKEEVGTEIKLYLKDNTETENYDEYLEPRRIEGIVKKYSDYVKYPIIMKKEETKIKDDADKNNDEDVKTETVVEDKTLNSMIPIWKKSEDEVTQEEYNAFYSDKFYDFEAPIKTIHSKVEGQVSYDALLFIPGHVPYDYYTKEYEKGLQLYSNGVLIMDKCADLLPDYFSFVKGLVDSEDISLNLSREMLQQDRQLKVIARSIEKKIKATLEDILKNDRVGYEKFFDAFGMQLKYGIYSSYGMNNDTLKDLLLFYSSRDKKRITLREYVDNMKDGQDKIYYASGESIDKIDLLPNVERFKEKDYEVLYLCDYVDEFTIQALMEYDGKKFANVASEDVSLDTPEEKEALEKKNEEAKDMFSLMKESLPEVKTIKFTNKLKNHPVCLSTEGNISLEMQKIMNSMPTGEDVKAEIVLEINENHPIVDKLKDLYENDKDKLGDYTKILYNQARLIEGLSVENPTELTNLICDIMSK